MLRTLPPPTPRRRGAQPGNTNARRHGFYASRDPHPAMEHFSHLKQLQYSGTLASQTGHLGLAAACAQSLQDLLWRNFIECGDTRFKPDSLVRIDRFFRTVSVTVRVKRALRQLLDEYNFLPDLAQNALYLCELEFTDTRLLAYACYGANQVPVEKLFVPQLLRKNRAITPQNHLPNDQSYYDILNTPQVDGSGSVPAACSLYPEISRDDVSVPAQARLEAGASALASLPCSESGRGRRSDRAQLLRKNRALTEQNPPLVSIRTDLEQTVPWERKGSYPAQDGGSTDDLQPFSFNLQPSPPPLLGYASITGSFFHLTDEQWSLLEPVMASLRAQLVAMGIRDRKRVYDDRFLLESILTRLAFRLRWDDLKYQVPVRACQILYKDLCTSGRMRLIYHLLHAHLLEGGGTDLISLVQDGTFEHTQDRISLLESGSAYWQHLTALLLLQRALYNRRRLKRRQIQERRRHGRYEREPRTSPPKLHRMRSEIIVPVISHLNI